MATHSRESVIAPPWMSPEEIGMLSSLRMDKGFMEYMHIHFPLEAHQTHGMKLVTEEEGSRIVPL